MDKIDWYNLSSNPNAIHLLEKNLDKINWEQLSGNPNAIHLLEKNRNKINWCYLSKNPSIFEYDYKSIKNNNKQLKEELIQTIYRPSNINRWMNYE